MVATSKRINRVSIWRGRANACPFLIKHNTMAWSKTGGTRAFIRGRVADDLYQVTHDKYGRKVQIVRGVEDSRINNNTKLQALSRMQMALLMGSLKQFKEIVDHSWENIPYGQLSIAHFVEVNMPLIQDDCREHWDGDNVFDYPTKGTTDVRLGLFKIAEGTLNLPAAITWVSLDEEDTRVTIGFECGNASPTMGDLKAALGANANDYITFLVLCGLGLRRFNRFKYARFYIDDTLSDDTVITTALLSQVFRIEGNLEVTPKEVSEEGNLYFYLRYKEALGYYQMYERAVICSVWDGVKWKRNNCQFEMMQGVNPEDVPFDTAYSDFETWWPEYQGESYEELFGDR